MKTAKLDIPTTSRLLVDSDTKNPQTLDFKVGHATDVFT